MKRGLLFVVVISLVYTAFTAAFNLLPRSSYSELEKRELSKFPPFSLDSLADGSYTAAISSWYSDTEPCRDTFMYWSMQFRDMLGVRIGEENIQFVASGSDPSIETASEDLIIAGRQAIDGDTAQVGPEISEHLGIPQISYVAGLEYDEATKTFTVTKETEDGYQILEFQGKALLTCLASAVKPRYMSVGGIVDAYGKEVEVWGADRIDVPETELGLKGSPTKVVKSFTKELLIYTGKMIGADEALRIGLVNSVVAPEELDAAVNALVSAILKNAPIAVGFAKSCINENYDLDVDESIALENRYFAKCFATSDQKEGMDAFLNKRPAQFKNE